MLVLDGPRTRRPIRFNGINYQSPQARGLVAWYPLMPSLGDDARDMGPSGAYTLAPVNGPTWAIDGEMGQVTNLDNTSSQYFSSLVTPVVSMPNTVTCWFYCPSATGYLDPWGAGLSTGTADYYAPQVAFDDADKAINFYSKSSSSASVIINGTVAIQAGKWEFFAIRGRATGTNGGDIWVNDSLDVTGDITATFPTLDNFSIGALRRSTTSGFFNGKIADLRIYNRALTDAEVMDLYENPWDLYAPERIMVPVPALAGGASGTTEIVIFESIPLSVTGSNSALSASAETASFNSVILDCTGSNAVRVSTATNAPVGIVAQSITGDNSIIAGTTSAAPAVGFIALDVSSFAGLSGVAETASATWQVISVTGGNTAESADAGSVTATWIALPVTGSQIETSATANIAIASFVSISPTAFTGQQGVAETAQASWIAGQLTGEITAETATAEIVAFDILPSAADGALSPKSSTADISAAAFIALDPTAFVGTQSVADTAAADFRALDLSGQLSPPLTADATLATVKFFVMQPAGESPAESGTVAAATVSVLALSPFSELAFVVGNDNAFQFVARATTFQMATRSRKFTIPR